jgi:hypothetical protein
LVKSSLECRRRRGTRGLMLMMWWTKHLNQLSTL